MPGRATTTIILMVRVFSNCTSTYILLYLVCYIETHAYCRETKCLREIEINAWVRVGYSAMTIARTPCCNVFSTNLQLTGGLAVARAHSAK